MKKVIIVIAVAVIGFSAGCACQVALATEDASGDKGPEVRIEALTRKRVTDRVATIVLGAPPSTDEKKKKKKKGK